MIGKFGNKCTKYVHLSYYKTGSSCVCVCVWSEPAGFYWKGKKCVTGCVCAVHMVKSLLSLIFRPCDTYPSIGKQQHPLTTTCNKTSANTSTAASQQWQHAFDTLNPKGRPIASKPTHPQHFWGVDGCTSTVHNTWQHAPRPMCVHYKCTTNSLRANESIKEGGRDRML